MASRRTGADTLREMGKGGKALKTYRSIKGAKQRRALVHAYGGVLPAVRAVRQSQRAQGMLSTTPRAKGRTIKRTRRA